MICQKPTIQNLDEKGQQDISSKLLLEILVSMSSFEISMMKARQKEGIAKAKALSPWKYMGRGIGSVETTEKFLSKEKNQKIKSLLNKGKSFRDIAHRLSTSHATIHKVKKRLQESSA